MNHSEFVAAYTSGRLEVRVAPRDAAEFVSQRMLLPWVLLPVFGIAVACALTGAWIWAIVIFLGGIGLRQASRATAPGYVLHRALSDGGFYEEVRSLGLLQTRGG